MKGSGKYNGKQPGIRAIVIYIFEIFIKIYKAFLLIYMLWIKNIFCI